MLLYAAADIEWSRNVHHVGSVGMKKMTKNYYFMKNLCKICVHGVINMRICDAHVLSRKLDCRQFTIHVYMTAAASYLRFMGALSF